MRKYDVESHSFSSLEWKGIIKRLARSACIGTDKTLLNLKSEQLWTAIVDAIIFTDALRRSVTTGD